MFKSNNKNLIKSIAGKTLILMVILGGSVLFTTPKDALAYTANADYILYQSSGISTENPSNPVPSIFDISPDTTYQNNNESIVTITGANFIRNSVARYDGSNRPTVFIDSTRLQMKLLPGDNTVIGSHRISVFNPNPSGGYSNSAEYRVLNGNVGVVKGASTVVARKVATAPKKTASIVLAKDTDYKISCEDDNNGAVYGASTNGSNDDFYGNQSANVLSSGSSFLPNTLFQWFILAFLVFLAVVIWRKVTRTDAEKNAPLKHA